MFWDIFPGHKPAGAWHWPSNSSSVGVKNTYLLFAIVTLLLRWVESMSLWNWVSSRPFIHPLHDLCIKVEQLWHDTDRRKLKDSEENLSECHFVHVRIGVGTITDLHSNKPMANSLIDGTAFTLPWRVSTRLALPYNIFVNWVKTHRPERNIRNYHTNFINIFGKAIL